METFKPFVSVLCDILLCILNEFLLPHLFIIFSELPFIGPDVPSVAIYSTDDKQSECCLCTDLTDEHIRYWEI